MILSRLVRRSSSVIGRTMATGRHFIAVCQMTSDNDLDANFDVARGMIERAAEKKCEMVFFPECFDFIGRSISEQIDLAMPVDCDYMQRYRDLAKKHNVWLSLGGLHHKDENDLKRPWNSHVVIDSNGETKAVYDKLHLFDLEIPGKVRLMESEFSKAGTKMVPPIDTPIGKMGLSICYDVRFAELSIWNRKKGAQILTFPAAFTVNTGFAHWESLLRTRAIENQCYVIASAQTGKHNDKRQSYGHSMVIDPWGAVVAQCSERIDMCFAEIDLDYVKELREMQPVYSHRRNDLYSIHVNEIDKDESQLKFGNVDIKNGQVFARSRHAFAFVNLKPVVDGHVLISPKRVAKRLTDLSDEETADLFVLSKKVQKMLEKFYDVNSTTVCVQDGKDAGQTVEHVHVHLLPRRKGDFGENDEIYYELGKHDKDDQRQPRSAEEMGEEAEKYRKALDNHDE